MKKNVLRVLTMAMILSLTVTAFASCDQTEGKEPGESFAGIQGEAGVGVESIVKTSSEGLVDTYTITFTDGNTTTFAVTNGANGDEGAQGIQGIQGVKGEDGHTPVITIQDGYWYIDGENTNQMAVGITGDVGNGISSITQTSTQDLVDTYTITYTDGTTDTFTVTNGAQGIQGIQGPKGEDGHSPVITIRDGYWYIDGVNTNASIGEGVKGDPGNGISSIEKTRSEGLVDTYTITYTDGDKTTFTVTNGAAGAQGAQGIQGIQGVAGKDGKTPVITIKNGYWYIDGVNSGKSAQGVQGEPGEPGEPGDNGLSAYEIYKKYHPQYTGTEAEWIETLKGADGQQGVSVVNAYVSEEMHLILMLSNNTQIDAGYIGVSVNKSYTVTFKDHNQNVLKTEKVYEGEAATAPALENRIGYRFTGWSCAFDSVNSNLEVVAQYEVDRNQLYFSYRENADQTLTVTVTLCGDVHLYGMEFNLQMNAVGLTYKNATVKTSGAAVNYNGSSLKYSYVCDTGSNTTRETPMLEITFDITGSNYSVDFTLNNVDAFDEEYTDETYALANASYHN